MQRRETGTGVGTMAHGTVEGSFLRASICRCSRASYPNVDGFTHHVTLKEDLSREGVHDLRLVTRRSSGVLGPKAGYLGGWGRSIGFEDDDGFFPITRDERTMQTLSQLLFQVSQFHTYLYGSHPNCVSNGAGGSGILQRSDVQRSYMFGEDDD
jgi:hypothetical protein